MKKLLQILFLLFCIASLGQCMEVYVRSTSSSDSGSCTSSAPCATIVKALSLLPDDSGSHTVYLMHAADDSPLTGSENGGLTPLQIGGPSLGRQVSFIGDTANSPTLLDMQYSRRFAALTSGLTVVLNNVRLINGYTDGNDPFGSFGGFVSVRDSTFNTSGCRFENGYCEGFYEDSQGGAIFGANGELYVSNCFFSNNSAGVGGTISLRLKTKALVQTSEFTGSYSHTGGWAGTLLHEDYSDAIVEDCYFHDNVAEDCFGAVLDDGTFSNSIFRRSLFERNVGFAGAVYYSYGSSTILFEDCIMRDNSVVGTDSTVMSLTSASTVTVNRCTIYGNTGDAVLGTILVTGSAAGTITNTVMANNSAGVGGAIAYNSDQPLTIVNCSFEGNSATQYAGAISVSQPLEMTTGTYALLIQNSSFVGNDGASQGGAIQIDSSLFQNVLPVILEQTVLEGNQAIDGGAIYLSGTAVLQADHSRFSANIADRYGGAVYMTNNALASISRTEFSKNSAFSGGAFWTNGQATVINDNSQYEANNAFLGGAFSLFEGSAVNISTSTLSNNTALLGASFYLDQDSNNQQCFSCGPSVSFLDNVATRAGPVLYWVIRNALSSVACPPNPDACANAVSTGNLAAGYGGDLATSPSQVVDFEVSIDPTMPLNFFGTSFQISGLLLDALNQTLTSASGILELDLTIVEDASSVTLDFPSTSSTAYSAFHIKGQKNFQPFNDGRFSNTFQVAIDRNFNFSDASQSLFNLTFLLTGFPNTLQPVIFYETLQLECPSGYTAFPVPGATNYSLCLEELTISEGGQIGLGIGLGLVFILALILTVWLYIHRNEPVVRAGSPLLTFIITMGICLSLIAAYMWFANLDAMCGIRPWFLGIGMSFIYACLVVKQWRLKFIFDQAAQYKQAQVEQPILILLIAAIQLLPTLIILIVWFAISPYVQKTIFDWEALTYSELCGSDSQTLDTVMISLLLALNVVVMGLGVILSLISGNVFSNYNEAYYLGLCMYCLGIALAIVTPIVIIFPDDINVQFFIPVVAILCVSIATLFIIYGQKLFVIYFPEQATSILNREIEDVSLRISFLQGKSQN